MSTEKTKKARETKDTAKQADNSCSPGMMAQMKDKMKEFCKDGEMPAQFKEMMAQCCCPRDAEETTQKPA